MLGTLPTVGNKRFNQQIDFFLILANELLKMSKNTNKVIKKFILFHVEMVYLTIKLIKTCIIPGQIYHYECLNMFYQTVADAS